jgi:hypothetical protein
VLSIGSRLAALSTTENISTPTAAMGSMNEWTFFMMATPGLLRTQSLLFLDLLPNVQVLDRLALEPTANRTT